MRNVCAVITAAGLSSRMGEFKPLLPADGKVSMIQKEVETFSEAGISRIIVVTGFRAGDIEAELAGRDIEFVLNETYAESEMFDSVCIGLRQAICGRMVTDSAGRESPGRMDFPAPETVLITPVDVPLFSSDTVKRLMTSRGDICIPSDGRHGGHPLLLKKAVCEAVLRDSGTGGLKGALKRSGFETTYVAVDDPGSFIDFDTPNDYRKLQETFKEEWEKTTASNR